MCRVLESEQGRAVFSKREYIEPVLGQINANRGMDRFLRRGRAAVRSEWRLIAASTCSSAPSGRGSCPKRNPTR